MQICKKKSKLANDIQEHVNVTHFSNQLEVNCTAELVDLPISCKNKWHNSWYDVRQVWVDFNPIRDNITDRKDVARVDKLLTSCNN